MASGLRKRSHVINYACLEYEATDAELLEEHTFEDPKESFRQRPSRSSGLRGESSTRGERGESGARGERGESGARGERGESGARGESSKSSSASAAAPCQDDVVTRSRSQQDGVTSKCGSSSSSNATTPAPTSVTSPMAEQADGAQAVCAFCGSAEAPLCFGDCELDHFPTSADFRISTLRRGPNQAPLGSLSTDKLADSKLRRRSGAHEARQSRRGTFIWAHRLCAQWSEGVFADGGKLIGVDEAVLRGLTERCTVCQHTGATLTCRSARCRHAYHLPCAALDDSYLDGDTMTILCPDHVDDVVTHVGGRGACRRCKSLEDAGDMFFCFMCGGHEHAKCGSTVVAAHGGSRTDWKCSECHMCNVCRLVISEEEKVSLCMDCVNCGQLQHVHCSDPPMKKKTMDWRCERCRACKDCGSKTAGSGPTARWHHSYTQCSACYQRALKLRPCSVCDHTCLPSRDLKCQTCSKYLHRSCVESVPADLSLFRCDSCCSLVGSMTSSSPYRGADLPSVVVKVRKERLNASGGISFSSGRISTARRSQPSSPVRSSATPSTKTSESSSPSSISSRRSSAGERRSASANDGVAPGAVQGTELRTLLQELDGRDASHVADPLDDSDANDNDDEDDAEYKIGQGPVGIVDRKRRRVSEGSSADDGDDNDDGGRSTEPVVRTRRRKSKRRAARPLSARERKKTFLESSDSDADASDSHDAPVAERVSGDCELRAQLVEEVLERADVSLALQPVVDGCVVQDGSNMEVFAGTSLGGAIIMAEDLCADEVMGYVEQEVGSDAKSSSSSSDSEASDMRIGASASHTAGLHDGDDDDGNAPSREKGAGALGDADADEEENDKEDEIMAVLRETSEGLKPPLFATPTDEEAPALVPEQQPVASAAAATPVASKSSKRIRAPRPKRSRPAKPKKMPELPPPPPPEAASSNELSPCDKDPKEDSSFYAMDTAVLIFNNSRETMLRSDICSSCGSIGKDDEAAMLCCMQCGHCYHPYCVNAKINNITLTRGWRCLMCMVCEGCGSPQDEEHLLLCDSCDVSYHTYCLTPQLDKVPEGSWKCKWCVQCVSCGACTPGVNGKWQSNYTQCAPCASKSSCSTCHRRYREKEIIVACEICKRWAHGACHGLKTEQAVVEAAATSEGFACKACVVQLRKANAAAQAATAAAAAAAAAAAVAAAAAAAAAAAQQTSPQQPQTATPPTPRPPRPKKPLRELTDQEKEQLRFLQEYTETRAKDLADAGVEQDDTEEAARVQRRVRDRQRREKRKTADGTVAAVATASAAGPDGGAGGGVSSAAVAAALAESGEVAAVSGDDSGRDEAPGRRPESAGAGAATGNLDPAVKALDVCKVEATDDVGTSAVESSEAKTVAMLETAEVMDTSSVESTEAKMVTTPEAAEVMDTSAAVEASEANDVEAVDFSPKQTPCAKDVPAVPTTGAMDVSLVQTSDASDVSAAEEKSAKPLSAPCGGDAAAMGEEPEDRSRTSPLDVSAPPHVQPDADMPPEDGASAEFIAPPVEFDVAESSEETDGAVLSLPTTARQPQHSTVAGQDDQEEMPSDDEAVAVSVKMEMPAAAEMPARASPALPQHGRGVDGADKDDSGQVQAEEVRATEPPTVFVQSPPRPEGCDAVSEEATGEGSDRQLLEVPGESDELEGEFFVRSSSCSPQRAIDESGDPYQIDDVVIKKEAVAAELESYMASPEYGALLGGDMRDARPAQGHAAMAAAARDESPVPRSVSPSTRPDAAVLEPSPREKSPCPPPATTSPGMQASPAAASSGEPIATEMAARQSRAPSPVSSELDTTGGATAREEKQRGGGHGGSDSEAAESPAAAAADETRSDVVGVQSALSEQDAPEVQACPETQAGRSGQASPPSEKLSPPPQQPDESGTSPHAAFRDTDRLAPTSASARSSPTVEKSPTSASARSSPTVEKSPTSLAPATEPMAVSTIPALDTSGAGSPESASARTGAEYPAQSSAQASAVDEAATAALNPSVEQAMAADPSADDPRLSSQTSKESAAGGTSPRSESSVRSDRESAVTGPEPQPATPRRPDMPALSSDMPALSTDEGAEEAPAAKDASGEAAPTSGAIKGGDMPSSLPVPETPRSVALAEPQVVAVDAGKRTATPESLSDSEAELSPATVAASVAAAAAATAAAAGRQSNSSSEKTRASPVTSARHATSKVAATSASSLSSSQAANASAGGLKSPSGVSVSSMKSQQPSRLAHSIENILSRTTTDSASQRSSQVTTPVLQLTAATNPPSRAGSSAAATTPQLHSPFLPPGVYPPWQFTPSMYAMPPQQLPVASVGASSASVASPMSAGAPRRLTSPMMAGYVPRMQGVPPPPGYAMPGMYQHPPPPPPHMYPMFYPPASPYASPYQPGAMMEHKYLPHESAAAHPRTQATTPNQDTATSSPAERPSPEEKPAGEAATPVAPAKTARTPTMLRAGVKAFGVEEKLGKGSSLAQVVFAFFEIADEVKAIGNVRDRFRLVKEKWKALDIPARKKYTKMARANYSQAKGKQQSAKAPPPPPSASLVSPVPTAGAATPAATSMVHPSPAATSMVHPSPAATSMVHPSRWIATQLITPPGVPQPPPLIHTEVAEAQRSNPSSPPPLAPAEQPSSVQPLDLATAKTTPKKQPKQPRKPKDPEKAGKMLLAKANALAVKAKYTGATAAKTPSAPVPEGSGVASQSTEPSASSAPVAANPVAAAANSAPADANPAAAAANSAAVAASPAAAMINSAGDADTLTPKKAAAKPKAKPKPKLGADGYAYVNQAVRRLMKKMVNEVDLKLRKEAREKQGKPATKKRKAKPAEPKPIANKQQSTDTILSPLKPLQTSVMPAPQPPPAAGVPEKLTLAEVPPLKLQHPSLHSTFPLPPYGLNPYHFNGFLKGSIGNAYLGGIPDHYGGLSILNVTCPPTPPMSPDGLLGLLRQRMREQTKMKKKKQKKPRPPAQDGEAAKAEGEMKVVKAPKVASSLKRPPSKEETPPKKASKKSTKSKPVAVEPPPPPALLGWRRWSPEFEADNTLSLPKTISNAKDVPYLLKHSGSDQRQCAVCYMSGEGDVEGAGRLLNSSVDQWLHANCAVWSAEVRDVHGQLENVSTALKRIRSTVSVCSLCCKAGCGVSCFACGRSYHVQCARTAGHFFYQDKTVMCSKHNAAVSDLLLQSVAVNRRCLVNRSIDEELGQLDFMDGDHVIRLGNLVLVSVGQLVTQLSTFHSRSFIYPVGFRVTKLYWSRRGLNRRCFYHCTITHFRGAPRFVVDIEEKGYKPAQLSNSSLTELWEQIAKPINALRRKNRALKLFTAYVSGEEFFGLSQPLVKKILEALPGSDQLESYVFTSTRPNLPCKRFPLPLNPSGSARTQAFINGRQRRVTPSAGMISGSRHQTNQPETPFSGLTLPYNKQFVRSKAEQYRRLRQEWRNYVLLGRSLIQGLGLFAKKDFEMHSMIIEYVGVVIRNEVANKRECAYNESNRGCYMFRIDADHVVDATNNGGLARYINHSCEPNCLAEIVTIDKEKKKIVIMSGRRIAKGEELTYDYKFEIESDQKKISCLCQAASCKKWMN